MDPNKNRRFSVKNIVENNYQKQLSSQYAQKKGIKPEEVLKTEQTKDMTILSLQKQISDQVKTIEYYKEMCENKGKRDNSIADYYKEKCQELEKKLNEINKNSNFQKNNVNIMNNPNPNFNYNEAQNKILSLEKKLKEKDERITKLKHQIEKLQNENFIYKERINENERKNVPKQKPSEDYIRRLSVPERNQIQTYIPFDPSDIIQYNTHIEDELAKIAIMESKHQAENFYDDPIKEYEDFIINEICPNPDQMTYEQMIDLGDQVGTVSKGLSKEQLKKLKVWNYSKRVKLNDNKCTICQFDFEESEKLRELKCKHNFHVACVDDWLLKDKKCPLCKKEN